ncbi:MAG: efflux RND transporter periplasmic adaptor subunit [Tannerellaceae bacterium]|nr:efflux RND transporter periplasmic adaptor subunit [Tannerellaceae bacterium]
MKQFIFLTALWLVFTGCLSEKQETIPVKSVKTDTVQVYGALPSVTFPGKIIAASDLNIAFRVSGPILNMHVEVGSFVRKGQVLAEIDPRDYETQLAATRAEYQQIKNESERIRQLYEKQSVAPNEYDKALYGLQQITAKYEAHQHALADTRLTAPCDGYIQKRLFEPGETVSAGLPVLSMVSAGIAEVEINIPSTDYIRRDQFDSYTCRFEIFPDKEFPLELIGITHKANQSQLYTMCFRLAGEDKNKPRPGMTTMVTIQYKPTDTETVSIPLNAVFEAENTTCVWIYEEGTGSVKSRTVKITEILANGVVVVSSGLKPGEVIVSAGVHSLKEGDSVKLLPVVSPTNIGGML